MMGLIDLPQEKWGSGTGRQVILKGDFAKTQAAILQGFGIMAPPTIEWMDATEIKVPATADCPAQVMMTGFPNILHPGLFVGGGLTDGRYRENTALVTMDFDLAASRWGTEKASQWYLIYALAGNADAVFTLKAMPHMRVKSQASLVISLGTLTTPATGVGYGFTTDELIGGAIYVLTGASRGLIRTITANNNDNGTGGTITYSGTALTLAAGDWFVVLPPATNFRLVGTIFNNSSGNIVKFRRLGNIIQLFDTISLNCETGVNEDIRLCCPLATAATIQISRINIAEADAWVGHPDTINRYSGYWGVCQDYYAETLYQSIRSTFTINLEFCRYKLGIYMLYVYAVDYRYPPGCGY
jgi:hypothetical protein